MARPLKFKKREIDPTKTKEQREYEATREMTDFYRQNPHRFISTELKCSTLTWFQDIIIYLAFRSSAFFYIATRGIGKSFIIAWIVVCLAILFPRIKIVIASSTRGQARMLVTQKIMGEIYNRYPNVRKEIDMVNTSLSYNDTYVQFNNGSQIVCVTSSENSRGNRCAVLVLEEDAKIDIDIKNNVLLKFLQNGERVPRYKDNPKYAGYKPKDEKKKQLHITSGEFQTNPVYKECMDTFNYMIETGDVRQVLLSMHWGFPCAEPFINMSYEEDIKPEMQKSTFSRLFWMQENEGLFASQSEYSAFSYQELNKLRDIKNPLISIPNYLFSDKKQLAEWKKKNVIPKRTGELRVLSMDVAVKGGDNDNTVYTVTSAIPKGNRYNRKIVYMEHVSNAHSEKQSLRMKQLYYDFDIDVICLDCQGNGIGIHDAGSKVQFDPEREMEYPAFAVFNKEDMKDRVYNVDVTDANSCIFAINQSVKFNHYMITYFKSAIENGRIKLPLEYNDAVDLYEEKKISDNIKKEMLKTNIEIDFFIKELIALEIKQQENSPHLKVENNIMRKDRYSSAGFANYWIQLQEGKLQNVQDEYDPSDEDWYFEI